MKMWRVSHDFFRGNDETLTLENQIWRSEEEWRFSFQSVPDSVRDEEAIRLRQNKK